MVGRSQIAIMSGAEGDDNVQHSPSSPEADVSPGLDSRPIHRLRQQDSGAAIAF